MQKLQGRVRRACETYRLIEDADRVAVGVSGGKDSLALLVALAEYRRYSKARFELVALSLDPRFKNEDCDFSRVGALCGSLGVEHEIRRSDLYEVIFLTRREKNPCALCARMRRGALHDMCVARGCNKLALGHHLNDVVETFYMNLFNEGRVAAFAPLTYLSRKDIYAIRPLVFCEEREIAAAVKRAELPVIASRCPEDGVSQRDEIKRFIAQKELEYPGFLRRTFTALQNAHVSGL